MPNSMIQKDAREGKGSVQQLEKKWDRAKDAAGDEGGEQNWALTNYIYQQMTAGSSEVKATAERVAAYLALLAQREQLTAGDLLVPQGSDPEDAELKPGPGGAPDLYEEQDEDNTPGVVEEDDPLEQVVTHGDDVVFASQVSLGQGFATYNTRLCAALGVQAEDLESEEDPEFQDELESEEATVSPSPMGTGSSPVEFQDGTDAPGMGPAPVPNEPVADPAMYETEVHSDQVTAKDWSEDVKTKWHPPEGFFTKSADSIAKGLKRESSGLQQAMSRLNFYINRAGSTLSSEDKSRLEHAKDVLNDLYSAN